MTLLYRALSYGIHAQTDEECLEMAGTIRLVLTELVDRIGQYAQGRPVRRTGAQFWH